MSKLKHTDNDNYSRCMNSAVYSLAIREHSRQELYNKLSKKAFAKEVDIDSVLDELEINNYLNEERFTESFIRSRSQRGQGILKISNQLRQRGINTALINRSLDELNIDWYAIATEQRIKKYGESLPKDYKERAKQMRFLSGRGFDSELIRSIFT